MIVVSDIILQNYSKIIERKLFLTYSKKIQSHGMAALDFLVFQFILYKLFMGFSLSHIGSNLNKFNTYFYDNNRDNREIVYINKLA